MNFGQGRAELLVVHLVTFIYISVCQGQAEQLSKLGQLECFSSSLVEHTLCLEHYYTLCTPEAEILKPPLMVIVRDLAVTFINSRLNH